MNQKSFLSNRRSKGKAGFTLIEILLVVAAISILAGIVIVAINPAKQLGEARNAQRRADVSTILNAVYQYALDNGGVLPDSVSINNAEVCKTNSNCNSYVNLSVLTDGEKYLISMPVDPRYVSENGSGYFIKKNNNGRVTVSAPSAELEATISVSR